MQRPSSRPQSPLCSRGVLCTGWVPRLGPSRRSCSATMLRLASWPTPSGTRYICSAFLASAHPSNTVARVGRVMGRELMRPAACMLRLRVRPCTWPTCAACQAWRAGLFWTAPGPWWGCWEPRSPAAPSRQRHVCTSLYFARYSVSCSAPRLRWSDTACTGAGHHPSQRAAPGARSLAGQIRRATVQQPGSAASGCRVRG